MSRDKIAYYLIVLVIAGAALALVSKPDPKGDAPTDKPNTSQKNAPSSRAIPPDSPVSIKFFDVVSAGNLEAIKEMLEADETLVQTIDAKGRTPLHIAATREDAKLARLLLQSGAKVDATDKRKKTPLHHAAQAGSNAVALLLLEAEADVEAADMKGSRPLHMAVTYGSVEIAKMLLDQKADRDAKDNMGRRPLNVVQQGSPIIQLLREKNKNRVSD